MRNKLTSLLLVMIAVIAIIATSGCATRIGPGYSGIEVSLAGSNRGVQDIPVKTGWVFYNPLGTQVIEYPTFVQPAMWTNDKDGNNEEISFNSKDGMVFTADIQLSYSLAPDKVPHFYVKYRNDDLGKFTHGYMRQVARDEFNNLAAQYTAEEIYSTKKEELTEKVKERINTHFADVGLTIEKVGFVGAPRPPQEFINAINSKLSATQLAQQRENELRAAEAEAKKRVAQAEGEAEANRRLTASLSSSLLEWRKLEIQQQAIQKWNGQRPMVEGGSNTGLLLQLPH